MSSARHCNHRPMPKPANDQMANCKTMFRAFRFNSSPQHNRSKSGTKNIRKYPQTQSP